MNGDVDQLMQSGLGQWLAEQTVMRKAAREQAVSRWTWSAAILMPVLAFVWFGPDAMTAFRSLGTLIAVLGAVWWGYQPIAAAKRTVKIGINSAIAKSHGVEYAHEAGAGPEFEAARRYGLVPSHDRSGFEDRWFGTLSGHGFELYEAHLEERRGSGKNRRWVTVFRGVVIRMGFGRPFRSTTLLQRAGEHRKWFDLGGLKDTVSFDGHRLDVVVQVHPDFDAVFGLFSDDQVEARVLVHPSYIEHLLRLEKAFGGEELRALFTQGQVIITVESRDLFESGTMNADEDRMRVAEAAEQFGALAGLALAINQTTRGRVLAEAQAPAAPPAPEPAAATMQAPPLPEDAFAAMPVTRPARGFGRKGL